MDKDLKDYLHLYLGSDHSLDVWYRHKEKLGTVNIHEHVSIWKLQSIHIVGKGDIVINLEHGHSIEVVEDLTNIKPILRPISSMAESELLYCAKLVEASKPPIPLQKRSKDEGRLTQWYYVWDGQEKIYANMGNDKNGFNIISSNNYYRCYVAAIPYLLKKRFDIFGLILDGLAIDSTKIKRTGYQ